MLEFRKPLLNDRKWIKKCIDEGDTDGCCYSPGNILTWCEAYRVEVASYKDFMLVRGVDDGGRYYVYPSGRGDIKEAVAAMMEHCRSEGEIFRMEQLLPENKKCLEEIFPGMFDYTYDRDSSEYVYTVKNMAELPGKRFHGKKGHVNAFFRNHTDISCDPITEDNIGECLKIEEAWISEREDGTGELQKEKRAIELSVKYFKELEYSGAILYADGKAVAFTMGEAIKNNTFCTHYEKTLPEYKDAYPVINNGFTKLMLSTYEYVNREEDTGASGLRKAKLSYHPEFLLDKYTAVLKKDPCRKYQAEEKDKEELVSLWAKVFDDERETAEYFFDRAADADSIYAFREDGKIVSAFYIIDAEIRINNENRKSAYLYAAATLDEYRGRGIMTGMIKYAAEILKIKGYSYLFLYPANDSLYKFYEKIGFSEGFYERQYKIKSKDAEKYKGARYFNTSLDYNKLRENIPSEAYAMFGDGYIDFAGYCAEKYGFERDVVFDDEDKVILIGSTDDSGNLFIQEAISSGGDYNHILSVAADISCGKDIILKTAYGIDMLPFESEIKKAGMIMPLGDELPETVIYMGQPCM